MALTLQELLNWAPEIADLAKATHDVAANHADSADFLRAVMKASGWEGDSGDTARKAMLSTAVAHDNHAEQIKQAATEIDKAQQEAEALANKVKSILNFATEPPAVQVDPATNTVTPPASYDFLDAEAQMKVSTKIADLKAQIADALVEGDRIDDELARAIAKGSGVPEPAPTAGTLADLLLGPLKRGEARNLGPVAGTGSDPGIPGVGAADLGEIVTLPDGSHVAIFGDSFKGDHVGADPHYRSVAVPVTFDSEGRPHYGEPLTGPKDSDNELFKLPDAAQKAGADDMLPAGTVTVGKDTYMMVVGTKGNLIQTGSWMVKINGDFSKPLEAVPGSWAPASGPDARPTQISGFQGSDGKIYVAADSFDRSGGVTMYQVDPSHGGNIENRGTWQPWTGNGFGGPHDTPVLLTDPNATYGELSFQEVEGKPVLSGFNGETGNVEVRVANDPTQIFSQGVPTTVVDSRNVPQPYGGFIMPGSTLDDMNILASQWNAGAQVNPGSVYNSQQIIVNVNRPP